MGDADCPNPRSSFRGADRNLEDSTAVVELEQAVSFVPGPPANVKAQ
jgi:hypothetical protein